MLGAEQLPAFDRYDRVTVIGQGGLATVYRAHDTLLDRDVAVKVFSSAANSRRTVRLQETEARRAASLEFPTLVRLYDVGTGQAGNDVKVYLVMEYVRGGDLSTLLEKRTLTPTEVAGVGHDTASALHFIHTNGLLHRDIKPANILLEGSPRRGRLRAKLTDLGIASVIGSDPGSGTTHGTAAYISPEQIEGADPSESTDVYALGLVLLESLTGHLEYPGDREETVLERMRRDPVVPEHLPRQMQSLLRGMTARQPSSRTRLVEVLDTLDELLADLTLADRQSDGDSADPRRLEAVQRYGVANSSPDTALSHIRALAQRLTGCPIAFIGIVDRDHVWVKGGDGVDYPQVDRDASPSAETVDRGERLVVSDARAPEWRERYEIIDAMGIGAIAAIPLVTTDGHIIGSLCVCDTAPRVFTDEELTDLDDLAKLAMRELEVRLAARRAVFDS